MALVAIAKLFSELNAYNVRYCHWKSNCNLERSVSGLTDLDLLVDPCHGDRFRSILHQHSVKPIVSPPDRQYPGIQDYLGFDPQTGQLFHLHVHYQLILGEQFVKNYHLPLEQAFLDSARIDKGIKIPSPELELIVLAMRALLKYRDRDVIKDVLSIRTPGLPLTILREFEYLLEQTDQESIRNTLKAQVDFVSPGIVLEMLNTVANSPRSGRVLYRLRRALRRELSAYQRHSRWWAMRMYFGILLRRKLSFLGPHSSNKTPETGGKVIAVIGADGAGKSTVSIELRRWLSYKLRTRYRYMGSQQPSPMTRLVHTGYRVAIKTQLTWTSLVGEDRVFNRALHWLRCFSRSLYHLSVGRDRYRRYVAGRRQAAEGAIVICDRYPLEAIHRVMEKRPMDGPQIAAEIGNEMDRITRVLSQLEKDIYRRIHPPDCILALHVSPEVSLQRKPSHSLEVIEAKSRALRQMDTQDLHVIEIDADQPYEQVLLQVKRALWQSL